MNPFAPAAESATPVVEVPAAVAVTPAAEPAALVEESADGTEYGTFEKADNKAATVPLARLSKVVSQRNVLRDNLSAAEQALARVEGQLSQYKELDGLVSAKYASNHDLLKFDSEFMETWDRLAKADPSLAQAAAKVKAAMGNPALETTINTPAAPAEEQATPNAAISKLLEREVKSVFKEALGPHIKSHFVESVARDVLANVDLNALADLTKEQAVEMAKVYFTDTGTPPAEYLIPTQAAAAAPKPATKGSQGVPAAAARTPGTEEPTAPQFKSREEFDKARGKRFAAVAAELFGEQ